MPACWTRHDARLHEEVSLFLAVLTTAELRLHDLDCHPRLDVGQDVAVTAPACSDIDRLGARLIPVRAVPIVEADFCPVSNIQSFK